MVVLNIIMRNDSSFKYKRRSLRPKSSFLQRPSNQQTLQRVGDSLRYLHNNTSLLQTQSSLEQSFEEQDTIMLPQPNHYQTSKTRHKRLQSAHINLTAQKSQSSMGPYYQMTQKSRRTLATSRQSIESIPIRSGRIQEVNWKRANSEVALPMWLRLQGDDAVSTAMSISHQKTCQTQEDMKPKNMMILKTLQNLDKKNHNKSLAESWTNLTLDLAYPKRVTSKMKIDGIYTAKKIPLIPDKYKKLVKLGKSVDKVESKATGKHYARKKFGVGWSNQLNDKEQISIRREAFFQLTQVMHPFILEVKDTYTHDQEQLTSGFRWLSHYVIVNLCKDSLETELANEKDEGIMKNNDEVMQIFTKVAVALEQIHSQNMTHRNISSDHVYLEQKSLYLGGHVNSKVQEYWESKLNKQFLGEWYYLAPEVLSGTPYDCQSDMWALGMLLYELVSPKKKALKDYQTPLTPAQVERGEHHQIGDHYSIDTHNLLDALIVVDGRKRITSHLLLSCRGIIDEIVRFDNSQEFKMQLANAYERKIAKGFNADDLKLDKYLRRINCMKINLRVLQFKVSHKSPLNEKMINIAEQETGELFMLSLKREDAQTRPLFQVVEGPNDFISTFIDPENGQDYDKNVRAIEKLVFIEETPDIFHLTIDSETNISNFEQVKTKEPPQIQNAIDLERALRKDKINTSILLELAQTYLEMNEFDKSEDKLNFALELEPQNMECQKLLQRIYFTNQRYPNLIECSNVFLNNGSGEIWDRTHSLFLIGRAFNMLKEQGKSALSFLKCLQHDVDHFGTSINLGNLLTEMGANSFAGKYYQNARILHPQSISAHFGLVLSVKMCTRDCEAAIKIFKSVLRVDPSNYQVLTQLATIRFFLQQDEKCATLLFAALQINKEYLPALATMGELMRMRGCLEKAKFFYEQILKHDPKQMTTYKALAKISLQNGDVNEAYNHFESARQLSNDVTINENDLFILDDDWKVKLGIKMLNDDQTRKAYILFYDALKQNKNFAFASKNLAKLSLWYLIEDHKQKNEQFSEADIVRWLLWMFKKVLRLHLVNKVHGELSLWNVIVQNENKFSLLGGTKHFSFGPDPNFQPPEGKSCDVWALGCILQCLCTHEAPNPVELYAGNIPDISVQYSKKLNNLLKSLLLTDATKRPTVNAIQTKLVQWVTFGSKFKTMFGIQNQEENYGKPYQQYTEDFTIIRELGKKQSGSVWLVKNDQGKQFISDIQENVTDPLQAKLNFRLLQKIAHENVVNAIECYFDPTKTEIIMVLQHCPYGDIRHQINIWIQQKQTVPYRIVMCTMIQVLEGLLFTHNRGSVHKDLRPESLFLMEDGTVKIGNFLLNDSQRGNVHYRAPETWLENIHTTKSDVWQLGCLLHEMITGQMIFKHGTQAEVSREQPCRLSDSYDQNLRYLIWRMLTKNPDERPSVAELLNVNFILEYKREQGIKIKLNKVLGPSLSQLLMMAKRKKREEEKERQEFEKKYGKMEEVYYSETESIHTDEEEQVKAYKIQKKKERDEKKAIDALKRKRKEEGDKKKEAIFKEQNDKKVAKDKIKRSLSKFGTHALKNKKQQIMDQQKKFLEDMHNFNITDDFLVSNSSMDTQSKKRLHMLKKKDAESSSDQAMTPLIVKNQDAKMKLCFESAFENQQKLEKEKRMQKMSKSINTFTPCGNFLQKLAPHLMHSHRMTHIQYDHNLFGKMTHLCFKFTGDVLSPAKGTYSKGKGIDVEIPAHPDIRTVKLHVQSYQNETNLYAIEVHSEKGKFIDVKPLVWSPRHYGTELVHLEPGQRIVAARLTVDERTMEHPCSVTFLIYDFI